MTGEPPADADRAEQGESPQRIGPYQVLDVLGEGGMGIVYRAMQAEPVRRRVAVKVIKPGMDTKQVVARFDSERHALAVMDHPGIAKVYDGGVTEAGRPYFAMELVQGVPITEYCDTHRLTTAERIRLVIDACAAVQHAHQKGVIHRDLKPSNILVAFQDGLPVTKIIDFGIAKAVGPASLADQAQVTQLGQMVGTPRYMSPEQAEMTGLDVDTRTDIYSMGMILYELLVGTLPLKVDTMAEAALPFVVRHRDSPRPSTRFGSLPDSWESIARLRKSDPQSLRRELRGDLDWIVMHSIDPDRTRRYETADALAMDLRRFLAHEPVLARPPSAAYRVGKFVRRNRPVVAMGGVLAALTLVFATTMAVQAARVAGERDRASLEAQTAQRVSDFMVELFAVSDPSEARGRSITALEILERGAARVESELSDEPVVQGRLMGVMGSVYLGLGLYDTAEELFQKALEAHRRGAGLADTTVATSLSRLAWLYRSQRRFDDALPLARQAAQIYEETLGVDHPVHASVLQIIGMIERDLGDFEAARVTLQRSLELRRTKLGPDHVDVGWSLYHLGWLAYLEGHYHEARGHYEEAIPILEGALPSDDPQLAWGYNDMAVVLSALGEYGEAQSMHERILAIREKTQGANHPDVATTLNNLATVLRTSGDDERALDHFQRALTIREQTFGREHPLVAVTLNNMGLTLQEMGRYAEARDRYVSALGITEAIRGPSHPDVVSPLNNLGFLYRYVGDAEAARPILERALRLTEDAYGPDHVDLIYPLVNLGFLERDLGRDHEAIPFMERAYTIAEGAYGEDHSQLVDIAVYSASVLNTAGDVERAAEIIERAHRIIDADGGVSASSRIPVYWEFAVIRRALGDTVAADSSFERALELSRTTDGEQSGRYAHWQADYWALAGDLEKAIEWFNRAVESGYRDPWLLRDPDLDLIRGHPDYEAAAAEIRRAVRLDGGDGRSPDA